MKRKYHTSGAKRHIHAIWRRPQWLLVWVVLLATGLGFLLGRSQQQSVIHINPDEVFASFTLTKELDAKLKNLEQSRKTLLSNLEFRIRDFQQREVTTDSINSLVREYEFKQQQFTEDQQQETMKYNEQIWTQLSQYLQDYCEENGYTYLFSSGGNSQVLGADPSRDQTEAVIQYVNQKYEGV